jgi:multicomponent Na+:H+ antiporter subunit F
MSWAFGAALALVLLAALVLVVSIVRPTSLGDRAVAFDALTSLITCGLLIAAAGTGDGLLLEVALVFGLLGFFGSVTVARFIERSGS